MYNKTNNIHCLKRICRHKEWRKLAKKFRRKRHRKAAFEAQNQQENCEGKLRF